MKLLRKYSRDGLILVRTALYNQIKRWFKPRTDHKYLFILSPPHCGSTLLTEILLLSPFVSGNNPLGTREGQQLPGVQDIMFHNPERWSSEFEMDWGKIGKQWNKYWDLTKPVLLEKSPPNLVRAQSIAAYFKPAYFLILCRNPYAYCESMIHRNSVPACEAAQVALMTLKHQRWNAENLENAITICYEELTSAPIESIEKIRKLIPEIGKIEIGNRVFSAHNFKKTNLAIQNLNAEKLQRLSLEDLHSINEVFKAEQSLLEYWGYRILEI